MSKFTFALFVGMIAASSGVVASSSSSSSYSSSSSSDHGEIPEKPNRENLVELDDSEIQYLRANRWLSDSAGISNGYGSKSDASDPYQQYQNAYKSTSSSYDVKYNYGNVYSSITSSNSNSSKSFFSNRNNGNYAYGKNFFAESESTEYSGYQQAFRYLGHLVKCGYPSDRYDEEDSHEKSHDSNEERWRGNNYCQRYLVWAAYVDLNYQGGGTGEYFYYDPYTSSWDYSACEYHGNGYCKPMDCHLSNTTTWTLMGVYKEAAFYGNDAFFEQLFKHLGVCVWNDDDLYDFISESRQGSWPEGCVQTQSVGRDEYGKRNYLYLDLKPTLNGNMSYGLYTDNICKTEYRGGQVSVDNVAKNMGLLYGSYMDTWNEALEAFKVCQSCMAYNLTATFQSYGWKNYQKYGNNYNNNNNNNGNNNNGNNNNNGYNGNNNDGYFSNSGGSNYDAVTSSSSSSNNGVANYEKYDYNEANNDQWWKWWGNRRLGDGDYDPTDDPNEGYFQCDDAAGWTNVNQCMKFRSHAELEVASWEDLVIATEQGGILEINVSGTIFGTPKMSPQQQRYKEALIAAKQAEEEEAYRALVASVPDSHLMMLVGLIFLAAGPLVLLVTLCWVCKQQKRRDLAKNAFSQPLVSSSQEKQLSGDISDALVQKDSDEQTAKTETDA